MTDSTEPAAPNDGHAGGVRQGGTMSTEAES